MAMSRESFLEQLSASGLIDTAEVTKLIASFTPDQKLLDGQQLAAELVNQQRLTQYQAEQLCAGKGQTLVLGNYVILSKLGQGGMGMVLKAHHRRMKRLVALKVMSPAAMESPESVRRFHREVEAAAKLEHPNIVTSHDADEANGVHFLVMQYVEGMDLSALVKKQEPLSVPKAVEWILQAARGLEYAHHRGVIHRDIKPANLLTDPTGTVKILDMGLARVEGNLGGQAELTMTGDVMGTIDYMAPEQAMSTKFADARSDIYSLGITLWYLLTGRVPYNGETALAKLIAHRESSIPSLRSLRNDVSEALERAFEKMVAKRVQDRFQSMTEVIRALESCQLTLAANDSSTGTAVLPPPALEIGDPEATVLSTARNLSADSPSLQTVNVASGHDHRLNPEPSERVVRTSSSSKGRRFLKGLGISISLVLLAVVFLRSGKKDPISVTNDVETKVPAERLPVSPPIRESDKNVSQSWRGWPADAPLPAISPFDADAAKRHQEAWAEYLKIPVDYTNSIGMKFRLIPPGEFLMGSSQEEIEAALATVDSSDQHAMENFRSEAPQHKVILTQPFYMSVYEVTQFEYASVMWKNPSHFSPTGEGKKQVAQLDTRRHPVENIDWNDAVNWCIKLSKQEHLTSPYRREGNTLLELDGDGYQLPTEARWEFACRAGTTTEYWSGQNNDEIGKYSWIVTNAESRSHSVGERSPNPFGLYDMTGNVSELCADGATPKYYSQFVESPAIDPRGEQGPQKSHIERGGNFWGSVKFMRSAVRFSLDQSARHGSVGFRALLTINAVRSALKTRESGSPVPDATKPTANTRFDFAGERKAAEGLIGLRGKLKEWRSVLMCLPDRTILGTLPENVTDLPVEPFLIKEADMSQLDLTDADLPLIAACRHLEKLKLDSNQKLTDAGLAVLRDLRHLEELSVHNCKTLGDGLAPIIANNVRLRSLTLEQTAITDEGMAALEKCASLQSVGLPGRITNQTLQMLVKSCSKLQQIRMQSSFGVSPSALAGLHLLRELTINGDHLKDDANITALAELPSLEGLQVDPPMSDELIVRLKPLATKLRKLTVLSMYGWDPGVTSNGWGVLGQFHRIEHLSIGGIKSILDGPTLLKFADIESLRSLDVRLDTPANRQYTEQDILEFRRRRTDIQLQVDGKDYPSLDMPLAELKRLDEFDPLPVWQLPEGAPPPVVAPCEPKRATELQEKWAEFLKRPVIEEEASLGMKFVLIPPGEFRKVITRPGYYTVDLATPTRRLRVTRPYAISTTEVTWDQFRTFIDATGYRTDAETNEAGGVDRAGKHDASITWRNPGWKANPNEPVTQITRRDADAFCDWLNKQSETSTVKSLYRLPTHVEWDHACRAGSVLNFVVGQDPESLVEYGWMREDLDPDAESSPVHPVAQRRPNPFGLHDMIGNVWELATNYLSPTSAPYIPVNDPWGIGDIYVGSSWRDPRQDARPDVYWRDYAVPAGSLGFRVLKQFGGELRPRSLENPLLLRPGIPMSDYALLPHPETIAGLRSWSIELAGLHGSATLAIAVSPKNDLIATASDALGKINLWDRYGNYQRSLLGHNSNVRSLDFSPDGRWLASCDEGDGLRGHAGNTARIWNVETGSLHAVVPLTGWAKILKFSPNSEQIVVGLENQPFIRYCLVTGQLSNATSYGTSTYGLSWSPDGSLIACSHRDNHLRIWNSSTLDVVQDIEVDGAGSVAWSPDGKWISRCGAGNVSVHDAQTLLLKSTFTFGTAVHGQSWFSDSQRLIISGAGSEPAVFNAITGDQIVKMANEYGHVVATLDEGRQAVFEGYGHLHFYDTSTGQLVREGKQRGIGGFSVLSPNGQQVFSGLSGHVRIHDALTGALLHSYKIPRFDDFSPIPSPDGKLLGCRPWNGLPFVQIVDAETGRSMHELLHDNPNVTQMVWSPNGKWVATAAMDTLIRVWNVETGKLLTQLKGHRGIIGSLAWSPDGTRLVSISDDKTVRLWDPRAGTLVSKFDDFPEPFPSWENQSLTWTDNQLLWIAWGVHILPLDVEKGTVGIPEYFSNGNIVGFVNASPDGQRLLAREQYGWTYVRGRDAADRNLLGRFLGINAQWHPDSRRFLGREVGHGTVDFGAVGFDVVAKRRLGILLPWVPGDHWICLGPTGHYRGSSGVEEQIVYVAMHDDGSQRTYTPSEFTAKFGWKNDAAKASLLKLKD